MLSQGDLLKTFNQKFTLSNKIIYYDKQIERNSHKHRLDFSSKTGVATAGLTFGIQSISAMSYGRIMVSNEKIRMGFSGVGNWGTKVMHEFLNESDCEVAELYECL